MGAHSRELAYYDQLHQEKYRDRDQSFIEHSKQLAANLSSNDFHKSQLERMFTHRRFLPAGRVQAAMGARDREVSAFNCSVSQPIHDSLSSIMDGVSNAARILRLGTGIGYNFSRLRPKGALIKKLQTQSSGPLSFMKIYDVMASTIASSGHRRGAQMGIMDISHPDIEEFIDAKLKAGEYRQFNLSVNVSDAFMSALEKGEEWPLSFNGEVYKTVRAEYLWDKIIRNAYNSAEPGVIFLDRVNKSNNLYYCEQIEATNPCAEQPLPPYGLCLLGSINLPSYFTSSAFNDALFDKDIYAAVEAYDNIFDKSVYAIPEHEKEAKQKRRMGIGMTGIANAIEYYLGTASYGSNHFNDVLGAVCERLRNTCYRASIKLSRERGPFELFDRDKFLSSEFAKTLPDDIQNGIYEFGLRNSHLLSYAPCGTISQTAHNVSSGVEPIFFHEVERDVYMKSGKERVTLTDYNVRTHNFFGKTLEQCTISEHLSVAAICQKYCDSSVSKTINVATSCSYTEYERIYREAYRSGSKGMTVFRPTAIRGAVIVESKKEPAQKQFRQAGECANGACAM